MLPSANKQKEQTTIDKVTILNNESQNITYTKKIRKTYWRLVQGAIRKAKAGYVQPRSTAKKERWNQVLIFNQWQLNHFF